MPTSSIPAVIDALYTRLKARPGLSAIQVTDGYPTNPESEFLWIADATGRQDPASIGQQARNEEYDLALIARVQGPLDDNGKAVRDRVFAIKAEVEAELRGGSNPTLGVITSGYAQVGGPIEFQPGRTGELLIAHLLFTIHVKARI